MRYNFCHDISGLALRASQKLFLPRECSAEPNVIAVKLSRNLLLNIEKDNIPRKHYSAVHNANILCLPYRIYYNEFIFTIIFSKPFKIQYNSRI